MSTVTFSLPFSGSISSITPLKLRKGAIVDLDGLTHLEVDLGLLDVLGITDGSLDDVDLLDIHLSRTLTADEPNHAINAFDEIPRLLEQATVLIEQGHLHVEVTRMELAVRHRLLPTADLHDLLHGQEDLPDVGLHLVDLEATIDAVPDLLFLAREDMEGKPLEFHGV